MSALFSKFSRSFKSWLKYFSKIFSHVTELLKISKKYDDWLILERWRWISSEIVSYIKQLPYQIIRMKLLLYLV